jgi:hypothetical protein
MHDALPSDGCCDHRAMLAGEDMHRHAVENLAQADALLFDRVRFARGRWRCGMSREGSRKALVATELGASHSSHLVPISESC